MPQNGTLLTYCSLKNYSWSMAHISAILSAFANTQNIDLHTHLKIDE